jgi:hypothetical protein
MKPKKATVKWYTDEGQYKGWNYLSNVTYSQARSWLRSGNYIIYKNRVLNPFCSVSLLINIFPR